MNLMGLIVSFFCLIVALGGCSSSTDSNGLSGSTRRVHEAGITNPMSAQFHAQRANSEGAASCGSCHSPDLRGSDTIPGCDTCHFSLSDFSRRAPEDSTWTHGSIPHAQLQTVGATCNACHTALRQYPGQGPENCHDCHGSGGHPVGQAWLDPKIAGFHGDAAAQDLQGCAQCHGSDFLGGSSGVSCSQCHFGPSGSKVPSGESWVHGDKPHSTQGLRSAVAVCNQCHTTSRLYANGPDTCHDCHIGASHPVGQAWLDKNSDSFHGKAALNDSVQCQACHGQDYQGGTSGVSCSRCHFGETGAKSPTPASWTHSDLPHNAENLTEAVAICNQCHTTSRLYDNGPATCHDCHVSANHPLGQEWLDKNSNQFHGSVASNAIESCKNCHGADLAGGSSGVSCSRCHFGPAGSRIPSGVSWQHGTIPHQDLAPYSATCRACHDLNRFYSNGPASCHNCHAEANHPLGQDWLSVNSANFHGTAARADVGSCAVCHGQDFQGGSSGRSCYECHFGPTGSKNPPTEGNWQHGSVPHNGVNFTEAVAVCNQCHTTSRLYGNGPNTCHDCHGSAMHATGQVWLDPSVTGFHGDVATQNVDSCKPCHGSDFLGGSSGVSCSQCHFGPTGSKVPSGTGWTHGTVPHSALTGSEPVCNTCHTLQRSFANGPNTCHDCHGSAMHATGQVWLDPSVTGFHGDAATQNVDSCKPCHGSDFLGGSSGVSCSQCHFGPTGSKVPSGTGWTHGSSHGSLGTYDTTCNACHTLTRQHANQPNTCHDCHGSGAAHEVGAAWLLPTAHAQQSINNRNSCLTCHQLSGSGGTSPNCRSCHTQADPPLNVGACTSCHAKPPQTGEHRKHVDMGMNCTDCHNGFGTGSLQHYYPNPAAPADIQFSSLVPADFRANFDAQGQVQSCTGTCHVGGESKNHSNKSW